MLPSQKLKPVYNKIVWVWVCRNFKNDAADIVAERIHLRFGVSSWPQSFLVDPATGEILSRTGRSIDSFLGAVNRATARMKPLGNRVVELAARLESAKRKMEAGKIADAKRMLKDLADCQDSWDIGVEAQEFLETINPPPASKRRRIQRWLESPNPDRRAIALEELTDQKPCPNPSLAAVRLLEDKDGLVRMRAVQYFAKAVPAILKKSAAKLLMDPLDPIKYKIFDILKKSTDPKMTEAVEELAEKLQNNTVPTLNPNVVKHKICLTLAEIGKPSSIQFIDQWATNGSFRNMTTKAAVQAIGRIGKRAGVSGIHIAFPVLIKTFPKPIESIKGKTDIRLSVKLAQIVHETLVDMTGHRIKFSTSNKWTAQHRDNLIQKWKRWYAKLRK